MCDIWEILSMTPQVVATSPSGPGISESKPCMGGGDDYRAPPAPLGLIAIGFEY